MAQPRPQLLSDVGCIGREQQQEGLQRGARPANSEQVCMWEWKRRAERLAGVVRQEEQQKTAQARRAPVLCMVEAWEGAG